MKSSSSCIPIINTSSPILSLTLTSTSPRVHTSPLLFHLTHLRPQQSFPPPHLIPSGPMSTSAFALSPFPSLSFSAFCKLNPLFFQKKKISHSSFIMFVIIILILVLIRHRLLPSPQSLAIRTLHTTSLFLFFCSTRE